MGELWVKNPFNPAARTTLLGVQFCIVFLLGVQFIEEDMGATCLISTESLEVSCCELLDLVFIRRNPIGVGLGFFEWRPSASSAEAMYFCAVAWISSLFA